MDIIFLGTIGIYHPLLAAHLYLDELVPDDFSRLKFWNDRSLEAHGKPMLVGYDPAGNGVYCLGAGVEVDMIKNSIQQLTSILNRGSNELLVQTIFIKREKTLLFLHRIGELAGISKIAGHLIKLLLSRESLNIQQQVDDFRDRFRFV